MTLINSIYLLSRKYQRLHTTSFLANIFFGELFAKDDKIHSKYLNIF